MKKKALIPLLLLSTTFLLLINPDPIYAANPTLTATGGANGSSSTTLAPGTFTITAGDVLVVVEWLGAPGSVCSGSYLKTPSDNMSSAYVQVSSCFSGSVGNSGISVYTFLLPATSGGKATVTCNFKANSNNEACYVFQLAGVSTVSLASTGSGFGTALAASLFTPQSIAFLMAMGGIESNCAAVTPGSGYSALSPTSECHTGYGLSGQTESWSSGTTTGPMTVSSNSNWLEVVIEADGFPSSSTTVVQACTWFQFQCWWYPFLFFMLYTVVFMFVGAIGGASGRGMNTLLLAGLTNASIAGTAMGMLTPALPIMSAVLTVVYLVRAH